MWTRLLKPAAVLFAFPASAWSQSAQLTTAAQVLDRYKQALGGAQAIARVQSMTVRGEVESSAAPGKATFVYYAKPFKTLFKLTRADGTQITAGFDGKVSWTITSKGAEIDNGTPLDAVRRDADLQYALHQPDYFKNLALAGISEFAGRRCYWLHGTTNWGKDNNQFYDVETGLLAGYRFQSDDSSRTLTLAIFEDYKNFGGPFPLIATKNTTRAGNRSRTVVYRSVSYAPLADSIFALPPAVEAMVKVAGQTPVARGGSFPATGIDFSGVDQFLSVGEILAHDSEPSPGQWQALLSTPGYRLAVRNLGPRVKDDIELALRPSRHADFVRASSGRDEHSLILQHLALAWARRADLRTYRDSLARGTPVADAVALAARFLPPGATKNGAPPLVTFAIFKADGYSFPEGIVVDLLYARTAAVGGTPLVRNLAHEFHHSYVNRMARPAPGGPARPDADLRDALYNLRNEGLADLIDKTYPYHSSVPGLASYAARYDTEYARTPATLRQLDSLLVVMAHDSGASADVSMQASMLFWSSGHPNGAYIAREILRTFGVDSLFPAARSPAAFLRTFQWAERRHGRPDPFSAAAWRELEALDLRYWR